MYSGRSRSNKPSRQRRKKVAPRPSVLRKRWLLREPVCRVSGFLVTFQSFLMAILLTTQTLDRKEAVRRINLLAGKDLRSLADEYQIPVWKNGHENKGSAGLVIERYLGLAQNSRQEPDFGAWELKVVPLRPAPDGTLRVKESMAITMLEPTEVLANEFENSHLYDKLRSMVVVSRIYDSREERHSMLHAVAEFNLDNAKIRAQV